MSIPTARNGPKMPLAATPVEVLDLCGDDSSVSLSVARLPKARGSEEIISLLDDDDFGDHRSINGNYRRGRKRNQRTWNGLGNRQHPPPFPYAGKSDPNEPVEIIEGARGQNFVASTNNRRKSAPTNDVELIQTDKVTANLQVLEVFPDADESYVGELLASMNGEENAVQLVITTLAEKEYPKNKSLVLNRKRELGIGQPIIQMHGREKKLKYDYMSTEAFQPTALYTNQAIEHLVHSFSFLSKLGARRILGRYNMHYAVAHDKILRAVKGTTSQAGEELEDTQYQRVSNSFARRQMSQQQIEELEQLANTSNVVLKTHRRNYQSFVTDAILAEEVNFVETKLSTWMASMEKRANRAQNKKNAQATHTGMECCCCFDEVAVEDMVSCRDEGHLFCVDCLKSFAETQIFGMGNLGIDKETKKRSLELKCFHSDGCASGFGRSGLEKALPKRSLEKYDEVQFILSVEVAGLDDIVSCPNCGYQAALQPSQRVFKCPVIDCLYESCRECGEAAHIPLRCDENKKTDEKETKGRLAVEEAISEAKIRKCPKCSKGVIKSDGCNKISCSCGAHFCYVCRAKILNYTHFCQVALCRHIDCKGCPLYTNGEEDDARAMRKAGLKAADEVRKDDVNIDVENILKAPP